MVSAGVAGYASRQTLLLTTLQACRPPGRQPESSAAKGGCAEGRRVARSNTCSQPMLVATSIVVGLATRMQRVSLRSRALRLVAAAGVEKSKRQERLFSAALLKIMTGAIDYF